MKKLFLVLCVSVIVLSLAAFAFAQQRGYQEGQSSQQYGTQDPQQRQYGTQDKQQGQYGRQDRSLGQYGTQDRRYQERRSAADRRTGRQQMAGNFSRASELMDKNVQNMQGEDLGSIDDLIITRNGQVAYLIVSKGGVLGMGEDNIPIPFRNAQFDPQQDAVILPNVSKQALENAPTIAKDDLQRLEDPNFERQVFSYYGRQAQQQQPGMGEYQQQRYQQQDMQQQQRYQRQQDQQQQQQRPMQQQRPQTGR
jgi:sporulation protein YlmC with PRC-barrel domain